MRWRFGAVVSIVLVSLAMALAFGKTHASRLDVAPQAPSPQTGATRVAAIPSGDRAAALKQQVFRSIDIRQRDIAVMVDTLFSIPELGFQEFETVKYVTGILEREGFRVERGQAGVPTMFSAVWGSGKPEIGLMADIDALPETSQKPGVAYHDPIVPHAPGHGEGHNAGSAVVIAAAISLKDLMTSNRLSGTIRVMPGVADEIGGVRGYLWQRGVFKNLDVLLVPHQGNTFGSSWGEFGSGFMSVEFSFHGRSAHAARFNTMGRSALDAVELMNAAWNQWREHLPLSQRSHYVITNGGDQPNVVPPEASVWYFLDDVNYEQIVALYERARRIARAAADLTDTTVTERVLGASWQRNPNKTLAALLHANARLVGMPVWSEADLAFAHAVQREMGAPQSGLVTSVAAEPGRPGPGPNVGGPPDDLGDLTWNLPVATLTYPAGYIPGIIVHHWSAGLTMATPIAHKGTTVGAKALAATALDLVLNPDYVQQARQTLREQTKGATWTSLLPADFKPPIELYADKMQKYRPLLEKYRFDPVRYGSYLEQLGLQYPTLRALPNQ